MKILLAVGAPGAGHEAVFDYLVKAGLAPARPSRRDGHTPQALSRVILQALEVNPGKQVPKQQLTLGRMWQELAADLTLANLDKPAWGWADHQLAWLMDFWQEFDPQIRLLLVYSNPVDHVAQALKGRHVEGAAQVEGALKTWVEWNTALLRYHLRHPQRTLLVNGREALKNPKAFRELLNQSWGVTGLKGFDREPEKISAGTALLAHAVQALVPPAHAAWTLEQQLHNAAQFPAQEAEATQPDNVAAWNMVCDLVAEQREERSQAEVQRKALADQGSSYAKQLEEARLAAKVEAKRLADAAAAVETKLAESNVELGRRAERIEALETKLAEVKAEAKRRAERIEAAATEIAALTQQRDEARTRSSRELEALRQENELLLGQLHQVQEDLEQYFLKNQQLEEGARHLATQSQGAEARSAELQARVAQLEQQCLALDERPRQLMQELAQVREQQAALQQQLAESQAEAQAARAELAQLQQRPPEATADPTLEFEALFWRAHPPEVITLDLRQPLRGSDWHGAEFDGRWSGPGPVSTLDLPSLPAGSYLVELDVIDAIRPDVLADAQLAVQGRLQPLQVEFLGEGGAMPAVCSATLDIDAAEAPLTLALHLGWTASPAQLQTGIDERPLGVRVQQIRLVRQASVAPMGDFEPAEAASETLAIA